ncbi:MAG: Holliday junction branch migration protein RuvA [Leptolyngbya foveolarum]|uniref:Holliday junction branch migration complex subunit RuvA n=1 Tax=Leptolyngbya foveolarum TaxID=47253 RepID=A0A2W4UF39_9CYAN|nr:MAG: Holliday junction branch migration protein RuvA [Leptolyngbya foveolarum]
MIGYVKGILADSQKLPNGRVILTVEAAGVGYDMQVNPRVLSSLPPVGDPVQIYTHLQNREDLQVLFGFGSKAERDVFRLLTSVSGIGPQMGMALLDTLGINELIQSVVSGNNRVLSRTPGVGNKTAERIILELKTKLSDWRQHSGVVTPTGGPVSAVQEDVEMMLVALGYTNSEIGKAIAAVGQNMTLSKSENTEDWIREAIAWLSR